MKQSSPSRRSSWAQIQRLAPLAFTFIVASPSTGCGDDEPECMQYRLNVEASQDVEGQGLIARITIDNPGAAEDARQAETWTSNCFLSGKPVRDLPPLRDTGALCLDPRFVAVTGRIEAWVVPNDEACKSVSQDDRRATLLTTRPRATSSIVFDADYDPSPVFNLYIE